MQDTIAIAPLATFTVGATPSQYPRVKSGNPDIILRRLKGVVEGSGVIADRTLRIQHQVSKNDDQHSLFALDVKRQFLTQDASEAYVIPTGISEQSKVAFQCDLKAGMTEARFIADCQLLLGALVANDYAILRSLYNAEA